MKILTFGEILWDIFPTASVIGGAPLNFCAHAVRCGAEGYILSALGQDPLAEDTLRAVATLGVHTDLIGRNGYPTGQCLVTLDENQIPTYRLLTEVAYDYIVCDKDVEETICRIMPDAFCFGTLAQRSPVSREAVRRVLSCYSFGEVFCDLNLRRDGYDDESVRICLAHATVLKLSEEEEPLLHALPCWQALGGDDVASRIAALFSCYPRLHTVLFTKGKDGAVVYARESEPIAVAAVGDRVVSTVGAGDSFGAVWLSMYLFGKDRHTAAQIASRVSGFVVSVKETVPLYDIEDFV